MKTTHNNPPRRLGDGDMPTARDWNMFAGNVHTDQDESTASAGDVLLLESNPDPILARINSAATPSSGRRKYGWNFVRLEASGAVYDTLHYGGGTTVTTPAYEASNRCDVPIDGTALVWLRPGNGDYYEFDYTDRPIWANLTGSSGSLYAWTEVYPSAASATFATLSGGMSGTTSVNAARSRWQVSGIPNGTVVRLERGYASGAPQVAINRTQLGDGDADNEIYSISILNATSGTFTITYEGQTTSALAYNINAATLETSLEVLSTITACSVTGTGTANDPFLVTLEDDFDEHEIFESTSSLKGDQEWLFGDCGISNSTMIVVTKSTITSNQNNYDLSENAGIYRLSTDASRTVTGFDNGASGRRVYCLNVGSFDLVVANDSASSDADNRVYTGTDTNLTVKSNQGWVMIYDATSQKWRVVGIFTSIDWDLIFGGDVTFNGDIYFPEGKVSKRNVVTEVCQTNNTQEKAVTEATTGVNSTTWVDLTGSSKTFTVDKATDFQIVATWDIDGDGGAVADDLYQGALNIDGTRETLFGTYSTYGANARATVSQSYIVSLGAASHTIKLQGNRDTGGSGSASFGVNSGWTMIAVPVLSVQSALGLIVPPETCVVDPTDCCESGWWCISPLSGDDYCFEGTEAEAYTEADDGAVIGGPYETEDACTTACVPQWWCIQPVSGDWYCFEGSESAATTESGAGAYSGPHADESACTAACVPIEFSCDEFDCDIPTVLTVTFSNGTGDYACLTGQSVLLTYNPTPTGFPAYNRWESSQQFEDCCGAEQDLGDPNFYCDETDFRMAMNGCSSFDDVADSVSCDPFLASGSLTSGAGDVDWVVS